MDFQSVIIFIPNLLIFRGTEITLIMVMSQMLQKGFFIIMIFITELAIRMEENNIAFLIEISFLQMALQLGRSKELLLLKDKGSMLKTDFAEISVVLVFKMLLQHLDVGIGCWVLALSDGTFNLIEIINQMLHFLVLKIDSIFILNNSLS